jgi:transposase
VGLSRRQFSKEFKLAAVRRLEQGVSIAEAARVLEVNPNVLHRWRREFRQGPGDAFPGNGKQRWSAVYPFCHQPIISIVMYQQ